MYCYTLQGFLGVLALAVLIGVAIGLCFGLEKLMAWFERKIAAFDATAMGDFVGRWILGPIVGVVVVLGVSFVIWNLGGAVLHQFFHFCVGGGTHP